MGMGMGMGIVRLDFKISLTTHPQIFTELEVGSSKIEGANNSIFKK
jgi:hypothetical protein